MEFFGGMKMNRAVIYQYYYATQIMISLIGPGMNAGYSAVALPLLTSNSTILSNDALLRDNESAVSWFASMVGFSGPFGCLAASFSMKAGRKISMAIVGFCCAAGWVIIATSNGIGQIIFGRFIIGVGTGLVSAPTVVYLAEIALPSHRLGLVTGTNFAFTCGIVWIYILGYLIPNWRWQAAISTIIPLLSALGILFLLPESPKWLLHNNQKEDAKKSLMKIRGCKMETPELIQEFNEMVKHYHNEMKDNERTPLIGTILKIPSNASIFTLIKRKVREIWRTAKLPEIWKPLLILNSFFLLVQFCGMTVMISYAVDIVQRCGLSVDPFLVTAIIGVISLIGCALLVATTSKLGVRNICLISNTGVFLALALLGTYLSFIKLHDVTHRYEIIPIVCFCIFIGSGAFGLTSIPWSLVGELYSTNYVNYLAPLTNCIANFCIFTTVHIYPWLLQWGIGTVIYFYCLISALTMIFIAFILPETRGIPQHEIIARLQK